MKELREILDAWEGAGPSDKMVLATVVEIKGSTYRRPGARLLVNEGIAYGSISGGCLESDLISTSWDRTSGGPVLATFDTTSEEDALFGYGLGCRGIITVLLQRVDKSDFLLSQLRGHLNGRIPTYFVTSLQSETMGELVTTSNLDLVDLVGPESVRRFVERVEPAIQVNIYGAGFDVLPLAKISQILGWDVRIADHRPAMADPSRFPGCVLNVGPFSDLCPSMDSRSAHVVMTHNIEQDKIILGKLLVHPFPYIGVLGPRSRTDRLLDELNYGHKMADLRSPVGLDIGSESPQEIALAIVSEIQAVFQFKPGGFLKDRVRGIHGDGSPAPL